MIVQKSFSNSQKCTFQQSLTCLISFYSLKSICCHKWIYSDHTSMLWNCSYGKKVLLWKVLSYHSIYHFVIFNLPSLPDLYKVYIQKPYYWQKIDCSSIYSQKLSQIKTVLSCFMAMDKKPMARSRVLCQDNLMDLWIVRNSLSCWKKHGDLKNDQINI